MTNRPTFGKALTRIPSAILEMLEKERSTGGLLEDVVEVYMGDKQLHGADYPSIWVVENGVYRESVGVGNQSEMYVARYEFYAIDYDSEDPVLGQRQSRDLALRIGKTLQKYWRLTLLDNDSASTGRLFDNMNLQSLTTTGEDPQGAANSVSMSMIVYDFKFRAKRFCDL